MEGLCFLKIKSLLLPRLLIVLHINVIIIRVSRVHLIRHVETTEVRRHKLSTGDVCLLSRH